MSLSAGSLASPCNSRLSREERRPSTLLSSLNLPTALITYALPPSPLSLSIYLSNLSLSVMPLASSATEREAELRRDALRRFIELLHAYLSNSGTQGGPSRRGTPEVRR